jgi:hypothetical protein
MIDRILLIKSKRIVSSLDVYPKEVCLVFHRYIKRVKQLVLKFGDIGYLSGDYINIIHIDHNKDEFRRVDKEA